MIISDIFTAACTHGMASLASLKGLLIGSPGALSLPLAAGFGWANLFETCINGLALGAVYAMVALGFVIIYRASEVFNFAQGEFLALGTFLMVTFAKVWHWPWALALLAAMTITGLLSAGVERIVLRPLLGRPVFVTIIITIFVGFLLRTVVLMLWGPLQRDMPTPWDPLGTFSWAGMTIDYGAIATLIASVLILLLFGVMFRYSRLGVGMRATSSDQEAALGLGVPVGRIFGASWFIAGALAAVAGVFLSIKLSRVDANLGYIALAAFPAMIVGGLDSVLGAVIAGLALGILEALTQEYLEPLMGTFGNDFHAVFPYIVMIIFLIIRPYGIFGKEEVKRV